MKIPKIALFSTLVFFIATELCVAQKETHFKGNTIPKGNTKPQFSVGKSSSIEKAVAAANALIKDTFNPDTAKIVYKKLDDNVLKVTYLFGTSKITVYVNMRKKIAHFKENAAKIASAALETRKEIAGKTHMSIEEIHINTVISNRENKTSHSKVRRYVYTFGIKLKNYEITAQVYHEIGKGANPDSIVIVLKGIINSTTGQELLKNADNLLMNTLNPNGFSLFDWGFNNTYAQFSFRLNNGLMVKISVNGDTGEASLLPVQGLMLLSRTDGTKINGLINLANTAGIAYDVNGKKIGTYQLFSFGKTVGEISGYSLLTIDEIGATALGIYNENGYFIKEAIADENILKVINFVKTYFAGTGTPQDIENSINIIRRDFLPIFTDRDVVPDSLLVEAVVPLIIELLEKSIVLETANPPQYTSGVIHLPDMLKGIALRDDVAEKTKIIITKALIKDLRIVTRINSGIGKISLIIMQLVGNGSGWADSLKRELVDSIIYVIQNHKSVEDLDYVQDLIYSLFILYKENNPNKEFLNNKDLEEEIAANIVSYLKEIEKIYPFQSTTYDERILRALAFATVLAQSAETKSAIEDLVASYTFRLIDETNEVYQERMRKTLDLWRKYRVFITYSIWRLPTLSDLQTSAFYEQIEEILAVIPQNMLKELYYISLYHGGGGWVFSQIGFHIGISGDRSDWPGNLYHELGHILYFKWFSSSSILQAFEDLWKISSFTWQDMFRTDKIGNSTEDFAGCFGTWMYDTASRLLADNVLGYTTSEIKMRKVLLVAELFTFINTQGDESVYVFRWDNEKNAIIREASSLQRNAEGKIVSILAPRFNFFITYSAEGRIGQVDLLQKDETYKPVKEINRFYSNGISVQSEIKKWHYKTDGSPDYITIELLDNANNDRWLKYIFEKYERDKLIERRQDVYYYNEDGSYRREQEEIRTMPDGEFVYHRVNIWYYDNVNGNSRLAKQEWREFDSHGVLKWRQVLIYIFENDVHIGERRELFDAYDRIISIDLYNSEGIYEMWYFAYYNEGANPTDKMSRIVHKKFYAAGSNNVEWNLQKEYDITGKPIEFIEKTYTYNPANGKSVSRVTDTTVFDSNGNPIKTRKTETWDENGNVTVIIEKIEQNDSQSTANSSAAHEVDQRIALQNEIIKIRTQGYYPNIADEKNATNQPYYPPVKE